MKELKIKFKYNTEFKKLSNAKEEAKINGEAKNWEDYLLKLAKIREMKGGRK
jgi:hypothetical protein